MLTQAEINFVQSNLHADVSDLALKLGRFPELNASLVLRQISGFQVIEHKIPSWYASAGLLFPSSLSLEQCSSELTAQYKTKIISGLGNVHSLADLTGGLGVDCSFMSQRLDRVLYIERQSELCEAAENNFRILNLPQIEVNQGDGLQVFLDKKNRIKGKSI